MSGGRGFVDRIRPGGVGGRCFHGKLIDTVGNAGFTRQVTAAPAATTCASITHPPPPAPRPPRSPHRSSSDAGRHHGGLGAGVRPAGRVAAGALRHPRPRPRDLGSGGLLAPARRLLRHYTPTARVSLPRQHTAVPQLPVPFFGRGSEPAPRLER